MGKTLILKPLLISLNTVSSMLIVFNFQLIQTKRILWFFQRSADVEGVTFLLDRAYSEIVARHSAHTIIEELLAQYVLIALLHSSQHRRDMCLLLKSLAAWSGNYT
jgi:hypothetical protein